MTGLSAYGNYLYLGSQAQNRTYRYVLPGIAGRVTSNPYTGYSQTRDIAWTPDSHVWVASDWTSVPLRLYNSTGSWVDYIDATLVPAATGVTIDPDGYLWVSDMVNDKIYKLDLTEGVEEGGHGIAGTTLSVSSNPFVARTVITPEGFGQDTRVEILDASGRTVVSESFDGAFTWDGSSSSGSPVPTGSYHVIVLDGAGNSAVTSLVRI